jgi:hypothetical protein
VQIDGDRMAVLPEPETEPLQRVPEAECVGQFFYVPRGWCRDGAQRRQRTYFELIIELKDDDHSAVRDRNSQSFRLESPRR